MTRVKSGGGKTIMSWYVKYYQQCNQHTVGLWCNAMQEHSCGSVGDTIFHDLLHNWSLVRVFSLNFWWGDSKFLVPIGLRWGQSRMGGGTLRKNSTEAKTAHWCKVRPFFFYFKHEIQLFKVLPSLKVVTFCTKMYLNFSDCRGWTSAGGGAKPWSKNGDKCRMWGVDNFFARWGDPQSPQKKPCLFYLYHYHARLIHIWPLKKMLYSIIHVVQLLMVIPQDGIKPCMKPGSKLRAKKVHLSATVAVISSGDCFLMKNKLARAFRYSTKNMYKFWYRRRLRLLTTTETSPLVWALPYLLKVSIWCFQFCRPTIRAKSRWTTFFFSAPFISLQH